MNLAYITFGILALTVLMLITEWVPTWVTGLGISISVIIFGILPVGDVLAQFYSPTMLMILSIFVLGEALFRSGIADNIGKITGEWATSRKNSDNIIIFAVMSAAALLSSVLSNLGVAAAFIPVVLTIAKYTKISRTKLLVALAVSSTMGGMTTLAGSPPNLLMEAALMESEFGGLGFFGLTPVGLPITIIGILFMSFIGIKLVPDRFDENQADDVVEEKAVIKSNKTHQIMSIVLFAVMILAIVFEKQIGIRSGHIGVVLVLILLLTRMLTPKQVWKALNWKMTLFVVGMLVLSSALSASGASTIMADSVLNLIGDNVGERGLIAMVFIFAAILTQFLNNTAQTGMLIPLITPIALGLGMNPVGILVTVCIGSSSAFATSFGTPANAMVTVPGHIKFVDWLKVGLPLIIITFIVTVILVPIVYPAF